MVMVWLWYGYGMVMVMVWLWYGYGMVMVWLWYGQKCETLQRNDSRRTLNLLVRVRFAMRI